MIIKLISSENIEDFNKQVQMLIEDMEKERFMLVNTDYKPVTVNNAVVYTIVLFFANIYKEQSQLSSIMNSAMAMPTGFALQ